MARTFVFLASRICRADMQILGESASLPSSRGDLSSLEHDTGYYGEKRKPGQGRVWVLIYREQGPGRIRASEGRLVMGPGLELLSLGKSSHIPR